MDENVTTESMVDKMVADNMRVFGMTPAGTKVEVVGKHVAANGGLVMWDVVRANGDGEKMQLNPGDLILKTE